MCSLQVIPTIAMFSFSSLPNPVTSLPFLDVSDGHFMLVAPGLKTGERQHCCVFHVQSLMRSQPCERENFSESGSHCRLLVTHGEVVNFIFYYLVFSGTLSQNILA